MRSSFSWFVREKIGHVSVLLPKIHFITIIFYLILWHICIYHISYGYCNVFKFITLRAVQNCKQCLHYGLTTFIKGKMKRKNALSHFEM